MQIIRTTVLGCALAPLLAHATLWQVGPGFTYTLPSQVSTLVADGDTVDIMAGTYPDDVAAWTANDLLLRGVGGHAHLESNGNAYNGKAIWVIQGDRTTVEWIEFSECAVPDMNGAGIRQEGHDLIVRHCHFHDNENGILAGEVHPSVIRIEHSEFAHNGYGDGFSHNLYINNVDTLIFRYNYSHHAHVGHELKSRAWVNIIEYNRFSNEADGDASREVDIPNGGPCFLIGNVIHQGPQGQNSKLVGYAMEGLTNPGPPRLYAVNNTLVNEKTSGTFFQANINSIIKAYSNVMAGGGDFMSAWPLGVDTMGNLHGTSIASLLFTDPLTYDYHIGAASPARNMGYPAGVGSGYPLVAWDEYVHPLSGTPRCQHATLDAGAFEFCTTGVGMKEVGNASVTLSRLSEDGLRVTFPEGLRPTRVELLDVQGRLLHGEAVTNARTVDLSLEALSAGVHLVRIFSRSGVMIERFVKDR